MSSTQCKDFCSTSFSFLNICISYCCLQFAVHCYTDRVRHIHFFKSYFAAIHPHFGLTRIEGKTYFWSIFFHLFISVSWGALCFFFPLHCHFASGGATWLHISWGTLDRYYSVSFSQKHMRGERAHVAPNKHLSSLCLRVSLKWDRDVVCKWTTSQNWLLHQAKNCATQKRGKHTHTCTCKKKIFGVEQMELLSFLEDFPQITALIWCLLHTKIIQHLQYLSWNVTAELQTEGIQPIWLSLRSFTETCTI